jgi:putative ribosome biogenesis GTPase RsgA
MCKKPTLLILTNLWLFLTSVWMCFVETKDNLLPLGWNQFFEKQVTADEINSYIAARVVAVHKYAFSLSDGSDFLSAVVTGKTLHAAENHPDLPVVGDWVLAKPPVGGTAVIVRRLERYSKLSRRQPIDRNSNKISAGSNEGRSQVIKLNLQIYVSECLAPFH